MNDEIEKDSFLDREGKNHLEEIEPASPIQNTKPKRPNKTQRKHARFLRQLEKYKEKKKQKREAQKQSREEERKLESETTNNESKLEKQPENGTEQFKPTKRMKVIQKERLMEVYKAENFNNNLKICIDCSFNQQMTSKEQSRLAQQIGRCYAINKSLERPAHLTLCNLDRESEFFAELRRKNDGLERYIIDISSKPIEEQFSSHPLAYLSPDSKDYLQDLDLNTIYIIGGLVDETVSKKVTLSKCEKLNIKTYALPIEEHMSRRPDEAGASFTYNKILTINQVFEILTSFFNERDWRRALERSVPKRKGFV